MATYKITASLNDTDNNVKEGSGTASFTSGAGEHMLKQEIGTSEEEITIAADITGGNGPGYMYIENTDGTNYVEVGTATGVYWGKLDAGARSVVELNSTVTSIFLKANTAACDVRLKIIERGS